MKPTKTQRALPAKVYGAGWGEDNQFYLKTVIKDVKSGKEYKALVRMKDDQDFNEHYANIFPDMPEDKIRTESNKRIRNQGDNLDLHKKLQEQIIEGIQKNFTNTTDVKKEIEDLEMDVILTGVNLVGYMNNGVKDSEDFELDGSSLEDDENKVFFATVGNVHKGVLVSDETLEKDPYPYSNNGTSMRTGVVEFEYIPAEEAKPNKNGERVPRIIAKEQTYNMTFSGQSLKYSNEYFEEFLQNGFSVSDPQLPSQPNTTNSSMTVMFTGDDGKAYSTRLKFNATDLATEGVYGKESDEYIDYHKNKEEFVDGFVSDLVLLKDPKTASGKTSRDELARLDALRLITMYTYQPNKFKDFSEKLKTSQNPTEVFKGVTALDYSKLENPSHNEKLVEQMLLQLIDKDKQKGVNFDFSQEKRLNLSSSAEKQIGKYAEASINKNSDRSASAMFKDTDAEANPAYDVMIDEKQSFSLLVYIRQLSVPTQEGQTHIHSIVPVYPFAPAPKKDDRQAGFKLADHSLSYYAGGVKPRNFLLKNRSDIDVEGRFDAPVKLSADTPDPDERLKKTASKSKVDVEVWKGAVELKEPVKLGTEIINDPNARNYFEVSATESEAQMRFISYQIGNPKNFDVGVYEPKFIKGYKNDNHDRLRETFNKMDKIVSPLIEKLPVAQGEKHHYNYQKLNNALQMYVKGEKLSDSQQQVVDLLFSDKKVDVVVNGKAERHNFSEITKKLMDTQTPLIKPVTDEIVKNPNPLDNKSGLTFAQKDIMNAQSPNHLSNHAKARFNAAVKQTAKDVSNKTGGLTMMEMLKQAKDSQAEKEAKSRDKPQTLRL